MGRLSKAQTAGNVVVLPTAVTRKVRNHRTREQRAAAYAAREGSPFVERFRHYKDREADALAAVIAGINQTPELLLVSAMLKAMDDDTLARIREQIEPGAVFATGVTREACQQAVAIIRTSRMTIGESCDLNAAIRRRSLKEGV